MLDFLYTLILFVLTSALVPVFILCYFGVRACKSTWLYILSSVHPDVEFIRNTTVRTLVDTRRNQGIFTVLVKVNGEPRIDLVRHHLQEVVTRTDKLGHIRFPKLRKCLVSRWGSYAWKSREFNLDQVLLVGQRSYRGRQVTENNIQEYVSDIVTKYLPKGVPPWQLVVLPCGERAHYLLLRMHHLLLTEGDVNIADLLPLRAVPTITISSDDDYSSEDSEKISPLLNVIDEPRSITYLYEILTENLTNRWNEFISNYDPLEKPELMKSTPGFFQFSAMVIITTGAILKQMLKNHKEINQDVVSKLRYIHSVIERERGRRQLTFSTFIQSIFVTIDPRNVFKESVKFLWWLSISSTLKVPIVMYYEIRALQTCLTLHYCAYPNTTISLLYNYTPLFYRAFKELFYCLTIVFRAPRIVVDELLASRKSVPMPLCGRKVVAWSPSVKTEQIREIAQITGQTETEILLTAVGAALSDYYVEADKPKPTDVPIIARNINKNYFYASGPNVRPQNSVSGMVCLRLPTFSEYEAHVFLRNLKTINMNLKTARKNQPFVYLMSILQTKHCIMTKALPSVIVGIILKYLSKKYTVSVTELMANEKDTMRVTSWGQEITNIIYWRPPQANISFSLCLNHYGDEVTLAVMSDALLSPHHVPLANGLPEHVLKLRKAVGL